MRAGGMDIMDTIDTVNHALNNATAASGDPSLDALDHAKITPLLDGLARDHARLTGRGGMRAILLVDQDAKVIAKNSMFLLKRPWNMGAIAAALHGIAKQASLYFKCAGLDQVSIKFGDMQFFVQAIGSVDAGDGRPARDLLLAILADANVKMGLAIVQMRKVAGEIVTAITASGHDMALIRLDEASVKDYLLSIGTRA